MTTFKEFPDDIVISIINYATIDIETDLPKWKPALHILGINRQWRILAKLAVFKYGYIGGLLPLHKDKHGVLTNMPLISCSAGTHYVKSLSISHTAEDSIKDLLLAINHATNSKWPNIQRLRFFSHFATYPSSTRVLSRSQRKYVDRLANGFVDSVSSIRTLDVMATRVDSLYHEFISAVINRTLITIDHFTYKGALFTLQPSTKICLQTADLAFTTKLDNALMDINPEPLQKLKLSNIGPSYAWNQFLSSNTTDSITFSNLQTCVLSNIGLSSLPALGYESLASTSVKPPILHFPRLRRLTVCGEWPLNARIKSMLSPPLEHLELQWWLPDFGLLNIPHLHFLNSIQVQYTLDSKSTDTEFFDKTNQLMCRINGVQFVKFTLYSVPDSLLWQQAQWPYLSALHVDLCADIHRVLLLLNEFPHLLRFKMCRLLGSNGCHNKDALLARLQITQPPKTSLEQFALEFRPQLADTVLDAHLQLLWWYFTQLSRLDIP
ncbi:hypothetical protein BX667DRAFT_504229 [Coemansia mojavensis]|nr:hypothetical protein BX667DRAFT_504229 [Coemansia mojavensis]